jgi:large conductance mechanosensitive channel
MGLIKEFRDFAMRGNVIDMAVGVIIGASFGKVITSLVEKVMTPPINYLTSTAKAVGSDPLKVPAFSWNEFVGKMDYVAFLGAIVDFMIVAFCLFMIIKAVNIAKKRFEEKKLEQPSEAPADIKLLTEIRDLLASQQTKTAV